MNKFKKLAVLLAGVMSVSLLAGCGGASGGGTSEDSGAVVSDVSSEGSGEGSNEGSNVKTKHHKIGVGLYTDSGHGVDATHAYLDGIAPIVDCEFQYITLSTYDEATNLTEVQNLISAGCEGIILTADMGTQSIIEECETAGVYLAGYLCDYNDSFTQNFDATFGNEYFLGTAGDGPIDNSEFGVKAAEKVIAEGYKNIGIITFPTWAYPNQADIAHAFCSKIDEYNASADEKISYTDITELQFSPLAPSYFSENPDVDCLFSIAAGCNFVYPVMVDAGKTDVKLITSGFEATADVENFGSNGNGVFQGITGSAPEAIAYPICLLIDKLNGTQYSDMPAVSERVDVEAYVVLSDDDMANLKKTLFFTANYADASITGEDIVNMCASYNPDATYAGLKERMLHLGL